jgi:type II secretory pathway predicted ATPase ExeA
MYEAHFGLRARPFAEPVGPAGYVPLPSRESALWRLRYGLEHGLGPVLAFGPSGSGKTLLAAVLAGLVADRPTVHLAYPALGANDILEYLADELAPASPGPARTGGLLRRVRAAIRERRPLLVVDDAHLIDDPTTCEALRALTSFATDGEPDLGLILVGGAETLLKLAPSLADRLATRCLVGPLEVQESASYVLGRLSHAGASEPLFEPDALGLLHHYADGLPRRLNRLADLALLIAYAREQPRPGPETVALAARELGYDDLAA